MVDQFRGKSDEWGLNLTECAEIIDQLTEHGNAARSRAKLPVRDGYPTRSMPESDIASGRSGDPTADYVLSLAGGRKPDERDTWKGATDPIGQKIRRMEAEVFDARNRLRTALSCLREALPTTVPDIVREVCQSCGMSKAIATKRGKKPKEWVVAEGRCRPCSKRLRENMGRIAPPPQVVAIV